MQAIILLIIRHVLAMCGAFFAAHNISGNSTASIAVGLCIVAVPVVWSSVAKWFHLDDKLAEGISSSEMLRTLLGALVSQGITALSTYFAIDANNPELLGVALVNAGASKFGLHQKLAFIGAQDALKLMALCACMLSLSSCATTSAIISSPFGRAVIATADQLAKKVVETTEQVGLEQIIVQATAKVAALNAEGVNADLVKETLRLSQIAGFKAVIIAAQDKYQQLTGHAFTLAKNPVKVTAARAVRFVAPESNSPPPCEEPGLEDGPGCMRLADRIPRYGYKVAFVLSTAAKP